MTAELVVVKGENRGAFVSVTGSITIGRSEDADLTIFDTKASSFHAKVTRLESGIVIVEDLDSTNGTYVNQERIEQTPLRSGDLIKIGRAIMVFRSEPAAIRLEDIPLIEGGSTSGISSDTVDRSETSSVALRAVRTGGAANRLEGLLLAAGELEPSSAIEGILDQVRAGLSGDRALYFQRHQGGQGAGLGGASVGEGITRDAPVQAELLRRTLSGEVVEAGGAVAAPIYAQGHQIGALYADGTETAGRDLGILGAAAQLIGVVVALDRSRRLTMSTIEIVGLAQAQVLRVEILVEQVLTAGSEARSSGRLGDARAALEQPQLQTALVPGLKAQADPYLFQRGMDRLITFARSEARGPLRLVGDARDGVTRLILRYAAPGAAERVPDLLDPAGVVGDLLKAQESLGTAQLAVARVLLLRAGGVLSVSAEGDDMIFSLELQTEASAS
ncbi:MAG: FHA domain-containing protein [Planctomycetes bacterium]|nr:FHA domain-containing protein [Planctomycetota bacterium]